MNDSIKMCHIFNFVVCLPCRMSMNIKKKATNENELNNTFQFKLKQLTCLISCDASLSYLGTRNDTSLATYASFIYGATNIHHQHLFDK